VSGLFTGGLGDPVPELRLARTLALGLSRPDFDLAQVVGGWVDTRAEVPYPDEVSGSLTWLADHGVPAPDRAFGPGLAASLVTLPLVLRTSASKLNVVSGAFHVARLLDPHPVGQWAAVAVSVVAACFLHSRLDFAADLIEALRSNDAPSSLLAVARWVPIGDRRPREGVTVGPVEAELAALFGTLYHQPNRAKAWGALEGRGKRVERLGSALLGARDGGSADALPNDLEALLDRLNSE